MGWGGGEADLVVDNQMKRAARLVAIKLGQVKNFRHQALTGKGGISMKQYRQHSFLAARSVADMSGSTPADYHWVDSFKVARVGRQTEMNIVSGGE